MTNLLAFNSPVLNKDNVLAFVRETYSLPGISSKSKVYLLKEKNPDSFAGTSNALVIEENNRAYLIKENLFKLLDYEHEANLLIPRMLEHLHSQGIKVLPIYKTNNNSDYSNIEGHRIEIIDFLTEVRTANLLNRRNSDIKQTAQELAKFHLAVKVIDHQIIDKFKKKPDLYSGGRVNEKSGASFLEELTCYETFYSQSIEGYDPQTFKVFDILREDFERSQDEFTGFEEGICHRDIHVYNVLIDAKKGNFRAFVDWDIVKYSPFVHDLAYAIDSFSSDRLNKYKDPNPRLAELFLNEYIKHHTLLKEDIDNLFNPLRSDMIDRTAIFMRTNFKDNKKRSECVASHVSLHWRMRKLESILK